MNRAIAFARLDFITVKPYFTLKNIAIMVASPLLILLLSGSGITALAMFIVFAALYVSFPFIICEKNGMDALYPTLSITRGTVVLGRYLFALAFDLSAAAVGLAFVLLVPLATRQAVDVRETLFVSLAMLVVVSVVEAVQLPIYFKHGYEKAKLLAYLPFILLAAAGVAASKFLDSGEVFRQMTGLAGWVAAKPYMAALIGCAAWLAVVFVSYRISASAYGRRDF